MTMNSNDTINSETLFKIIDFEEHEKLFVEDPTLPHTGSTKVEWTYKTNYKSIGEATDFKARTIIQEYKKRKKNDDDTFKILNIKKVKLILNFAEENLKLTKDGTHNFVGATYFKKLKKMLGMVTIEDLGLREAM